MFALQTPKLKAEIDDIEETISKLSEFPMHGEYRYLFTTSVHVRLFSNPMVLLSTCVCRNCRRDAPVMAIASMNVNVFVAYSHQFINETTLQAIEGTGDIVRGIAADVLKAAKVPIFAHKITQIQPGLFHWLFETIQVDEDLKLPFGGLTIDKRFSKKSGFAYYANICPHCDNAIGEESLQRHLDAPFHPSRITSDNKSLAVISPTHHRKLFVECGLLPFELIPGKPAAELSGQI